MSASSSPSFANAAWSRLKKNKGAIFGLVIIAIAVLVAVFAYLIAPDPSPHANRIILEIGGEKPGYTKTFVRLPKAIQTPAPGFFNRLINGKPDNYDYIPVNRYRFVGKDSVQLIRFIDESVEDSIVVATNTSIANFEKNNIRKQSFLLGTDKYGRDIYSRIILGTRVSLGVGFITVFISLTIGLMLGSLAGYYRGRTDNIIMWFINVVWSIPTLLLVFAITLALGKGFWQVFVAVGLTMWVNVARTVRGQILVEREKEYVEATRALGYSGYRTIVKHIWPNIMGPVLVIAAANFASAIVIEAGLSFIGIGVQPPQPSWGLMIRDNYNFIITNNPMLALAPGFAIMLLVLAFNLLGNGLRDALHVRGKI
ncbi:MAG TPA: ABC transporter permease [Chitinophagaceae bacterium]|nr:ABC transporter permease [Chitinophagaceae bacterium]HNA18913.1 ABC transporter permease [Chitinophagaceae bacterium]HNA92247.1 ABC transporter permease [Chitinophagaceae bacterium]HND94913.1 ABC transporter permease [Chitinophagaceae bacterium]HNF45850.1 ABC transporter permease [Chitinophagaceae bacterium]